MIWNIYCLIYHVVTTCQGVFSRYFVFPFNTRIWSIPARSVMAAPICNCYKCEIYCIRRCYWALYWINSSVYLQVIVYALYISIYWLHFLDNSTLKCLFTSQYPIHFKYSLEICIITRDLFNCQVIITITSSLCWGFVIVFLCQRVMSIFLVKGR